MSKSLKHLIRLILEDSNFKSKTRLSEYSLDDQIDSLILKYESESLLESELLRKAFLFEKDEEDKEDTDKDKEEKEDPVEDSSESEVDQPSDESPVHIDIDDFTNQLARLIMNYKSLLDIETVIINRAKNHLEKKFGKGAGLELEEKLSQNFGIELEVPDNELRIPAAKGAGPSI